MAVNTDTAKAVLQTVMRLKPTEDQLRRFTEIHHMIDEVPKFGNAIDDVDYFARDVAYTYSRPLQKYHESTWRSVIRQDFIRYQRTYRLADRQEQHRMDVMHIHRLLMVFHHPQVKDVKGPTAAATSVSRLDHFIVSNGTLFNQKFHPSALAGREGLEKFVALIRTFFDQKGMHMQFNVVDRETLLDAQKHPEKLRTPGCTRCRIQRIVYNSVTFPSGRYHQTYRTGILITNSDVRQVKNLRCACTKADEFFI